MGRYTRRPVGRGGFTLIEILVVIVIIGVLSIIGVSKYTEFTTTSRMEGCLTNQSTIDRTVGVWESQNVAIPIKAGQSLTFDTNGKISAVAGGLDALAAAAGKELKANNMVISDFTKDTNVFVCPERANQKGVSNLHQTPEDEYQWRQEAANTDVLANKVRGTVCLQFGSKNTKNSGNGPDGTKNTIHGMNKI